jgi:hypothetical protein
VTLDFIIKKPADRALVANMVKRAIEPS